MTNEKYNLNVIFVIKLSLFKVNLQAIRECTVGRSHLNVAIVIKLLFLIVNLHLFRKHTLRKSHFNMRTEECDRSFAQKDDLVLHHRKHKGEKLYKCDQLLLRRSNITM